MELSTEKQIIDQLTRANKVLVALPQVLTADSVASGLALTQFLKKLDKDAVLVSSGQLLENLKFLPQADSLSSNVKAGKSLVINVDTSQRKLEELSYQSVDQRAQIFLKADVGTFEATDISFTADKFPVDVIVVLDAKSLEDLGALFEKNTDLFFETPKINIDNKPGNEYFGAINFVDIAASSVAEILASLFEKFETKLEQYNGNLVRAAVELAKDWRTDKILRRLEALLIAADTKNLLVISGMGDVIEPDDGVIAIGSGGPYATAAAKALVEHSSLKAKDIAEKALKIAANICIYTNEQITSEEV